MTTGTSSIRHAPGTDWSVLTVTSLGRRPLRVALAGAGNVGTAVTHLLQDAGHEIVGIASRSLESVSRAERSLGIAAAKPLGDVARAADLVLIGAADGSIGYVAGEIGPGLDSGTMVWHFAGALGPGAVTAILPTARVTAAHPVQACPDIATARRRLPGSAWGVTSTDAEVQRSSTELIETDLGGTAVDVEEEDRAVWHAASVTTSNGIAALMAAGEGMLASIGVRAPEHVLGPLATGTVSNAREGGGGAGTLTGPVVRGELLTIERHLDALRGQPRLVEGYVQAARMVLSVALASGRIEQDVAAAIAGVLDAR